MLHFVESLHARTKPCLNLSSEFTLTPWKQQEAGGKSPTAGRANPLPQHLRTGFSAGPIRLASLRNARHPRLCTTSVWCPELSLHTVIICQSDFKYANKNHIVGAVVPLLGGRLMEDLVGNI